MATSFKDKTDNEVTQEQKDIVKSAFLDPKSAAAYSSVEKVYRQCKEYIKGLTRGTVSNILSTEPEFTQHRRFKAEKGRKIVYRSSIPFHETGIDLCDVHNLSSKNANVKFLFLFQCTLSRYLIVIPLRSKSSESIRYGFEQFYAHPFVHGKKGVIFWSDKESGVKSNEAWLKQVYDATVIHSKSLSQTKSILIEIAVKQLTNRLMRFLSHLGQITYLDHLKDIVDGINSSPRKELYMKSAKEVVNDPSAMRLLLKRKINEEITRESKNAGKTPFYRIGDLVLAKNWPPSLFKKSFLPKFQPTPRKVVSIKLSIPVMYTLEGLPNFRFYKSQLSLVKRGSQIFSEKINKQEPQESSRQKFKLIKTRLDEDRKTRNGKVLSYAKFYQIEDSKKKKDWIDEKAYQSLLEKDQITNHE